MSRGVLVGRRRDVTLDPPSARILVVDDEPNIAELLSAALSFEGYQVGVAATGAEAIEQVRAFRPNLVMLDVMLPDFDGNEVCRRLRNQGEQMPIVFLTARDTTQDKVEGLSMGDDYVTKPFSIEELMARVGAILRRAGEMVAADTVQPAVRRPHHERRHPRGVAQRQAIDLTATEFNLLRYLLENARAGHLQVRAPRQRLGLRLPRRPQHRRDLHQLPAQEDRRPRAAAHPYHPARRLHPPPAPRRMSLQRRLVAVMALLLVAGLLVADVVTYASVRSFLYGQADSTLGPERGARLQLPALLRGAQRCR